MTRGRRVTRSLRWSCCGAKGEPDAVAHTPGGIGGLLDDQVQTAAAALDGHQVTGDPAWLGWADAIMDRVWREYWDEEHGGLFDTARGREDETGVPAARAKPVQDTPTPSPNGVAGIVAARLHELTGSPRWRERGSALVAAFAGRAAELGLYAATYLIALDWQVSPSTHLVIVGPRGDRHRGGDASARAGDVRSAEGGAASHTGGGRHPATASSAHRHAGRRERVASLLVHGQHLQSSRRDARGVAGDAPRPGC